MRHLLITGNSLKTPTSQLANAGRSGGVFLLVFVVWAGSACGQSSLPVADGVDARDLRHQCQQLLDALAKMKAPLPMEAERELRGLLKDEKKSSDETAEKI